MRIENSILLKKHACHFNNAIRHRLFVCILLLLESLGPLCAGHTAHRPGGDPRSTFARAAPRLGADSNADFQRAARRTDGQSGGGEPGVGGA
jgi:hypothetical protein